MAHRNPAIPIAGPNYLVASFHPAGDGTSIARTKCIPTLLALMRGGRAHMVEPVTTLVLSSLVKATANLVSGYATERAKVVADVSIRREQYAFQRDSQRTTFDQQVSLERQRAQAAQDLAIMAAKLQQANVLNDRQLQIYPIADGPGTLRAALQMSGRDPRDAPLLVLFSPPQNEDPSNQTWVGLGQRVQDDLMAYHRGFARTRRTDRAFQWPHYAFYENDLYGIPTLIVQISISSERLDVHLGGCHLHPSSSQDTSNAIQEPQFVYGLRWPSSDDWDGESIARLNRTAPIARFFPLGAAQCESDLRELNLEYASRIITLCVVAAMDVYYLVHTPAYDERIDAAAEAAGVVGDNWPADLGLPLDVVVDAPYHRMHSALRRLRRGDNAGGIADLAEAMAILANTENTGDLEALTRRASQCINMQEHHRVKAAEAFALVPAESLPSEWSTLLAVPIRHECPEQDPRSDRGQHLPAIKNAFALVRSTTPSEPALPIPGQTERSRRANQDPLADPSAP